ncbi:tripartite tricarboxylate transporter TctB family protein [Salinarimonas rosea]|uniref:tripartite tricarboxylate transporter TctB family protein n=1 Tax=Salinarimonas rosea TaxID=552063 RepID=UPI000417A55A|nr:tripartite tricarboxylate transporter TctB family protein [Salinarimonas rosea]
MTRRPDWNQLAAAGVPLALMGGSAWAMWQAWGYGIGSLRMPGPGGYPFVLAAGLFVAAAGAVVTPLVRIARSPRQDAATDPRATGDAEGGGLTRAAMLVGVLLAWGLLFEVIGFVLASLICALAICWIGGQRSPIRALVFSSVLTASCYLLFVGVLGLPL